MKSICMLGAAAAALAWASGACAQAAPSTGLDDAIAIAITKGKPILEMRARYEHADQDGLAKAADAYTLRTRLGWETGAVRGLKALVELEDVRALAAVHYNVAVPGVAGASLNGKTRYPIVNDPQVTELNRAQLSWAISPVLTLTGGRQRILIDDQRFVGNVGWRQDEQTFDAVRADLALGKLKATYAYVWKVNRVLGEARDWSSDSHLVNVSYPLARPLTVEGFFYGLRFPNAAVNGSQTWGARATGRTKAGRATLAYDATWARQSDWRHATAPFGLDYYQADVAASLGIWTARVDYEVLQGDGARGFVTPLATTHGFQGWADAFAAVGGNKTFVDGLHDLNLQLVARPKTPLAPLELTARWHDFHADRTGAALGREWDLQASAAATRHLTLLLKYADFRRAAAVPAGTAAPPASRSKLWLSAEYRL